MKWIMKPNIDQVAHIAENLRVADATEVRLSHNCSPYEAVEESWGNSHVARGMETDDGEPCGLCGLVGHRIWMLGTDRLTENRRARWQLCVEGRKWVDSCLEEMGGPLFNDVYSKNTDSIRWLKHLGFTVDRPKPMGHSAALFCHFWRSV